MTVFSWEISSVPIALYNIDYNVILVVQEDLLDYEEDDLLDIEIKDICTSDPDASDIKKAKTVHTPIPVPGHSKHKNALEVRAIC